MQIEDQLLKRRVKGNYRSLKSPVSLVDFASNDYLGLARRVKIYESGGSTGSRLLTGNSEFAEQLENKIAKFHGYEAGLLFGSGYLANLGLISTIASPGEAIFYDAYIHASTLDGIKLSRAQGFPFRHNDLEHLEKRLKASKHKSKVICAESVYSTDGSLAPLDELCKLSRLYEARLIIDEAHAAGVLGPEGKGLVAEKNLTSSVFSQVVTFGKAVGAYGAIALGSTRLKDFLINFSRPFIYTTALPTAMLESINDAYDQIPLMEQEREHLKSLSALFPNSPNSPIKAVQVKGNENAIALSLKLSHAGFDVRPLLSPTVRQGHEVLRISLHAYNMEAEVNALLKQI